LDNLPNERMFLYQHVLRTDLKWKNVLLQALPPLFYEYVNPFGLSQMNLDEHLPLEVGISDLEEQQSGDSMMTVSE